MTARDGVGKQWKTESYRLNMPKGPIFVGSKLTSIQANCKNNAHYVGRASNTPNRLISI